MSGYASLLSHLHNTSTTLPLPTIQAALAHHLAQLSPLPTPLAATIVSSPLFLAHPFSHPKLQVLLTAFRHATHLKYRELKKAEDNQSAVSAAFARSTKTRLRLWVGAVLKGIAGGQPILRLACCGGLLAGSEDLKSAEHLEVGGRSQLEDEVVIVVAEAMDMYSYRYSDAISSAASGWDNEFQLVGDVDAMTLALILASQSLVLVAPGKLKALPLSVLTEHLTSVVASTFSSGTFLSVASSSSKEIGAALFSLQTINESPLMAFIAPISKLTALTLIILCESHPLEGLSAAAAALDVLRPISKTVESDWTRNPLDKDDNTRELMALVWTILKTLLFSNIMIADAALSAVIFVPPTAYTSPGATPSALALTVLHTLFNLSFVVSQFGGVTTTASPGFVELKKTFYLALDILAKSEEESNRFVRELCLSFREWQGHRDGRDTDIQAKKAYALASIEQLIPVLSDEIIQSYALPLCLPHLSDATYRETYESSHSVVLAIFASHADRHATGERGSKSSDTPAQGSTFTERMVPFYAQCLIENSVDGRLSTSQLRLAFSSLVRSASASASSPSAAGGLVDDTYTLAWYCVDALLDAIHGLSSQDRGRTPSTVDGRLHRLHLTLISVVPSLPLKLLPPVLQEIRTILSTHGSAQSDSGGKVGELADAIFVEISDRVGDREKEYVMRWWYDNQNSFPFRGDNESRAKVSMSTEKQSQSRL
ncbi:hypothetical protein B0H10DRAFT_2163956 [Mycena sp. CBHHK59/15]|nr:hypothetical protein B0H10DRAFT_2163956 [Mycena sp. CBHHK59/15]